MRFACLSFLAFLLSSANLRADDAADARAIVARAMKATGIPADDKLVTATYQIKGKSISGGVETAFTGDVAYQSPDKYRFTIRAEAKIEVVRQGPFRRRPPVTTQVGGITVDLLAVVNGKKAWVSALGMTQEVTGEQLEGALAELDQFRISSLTPLLVEKEFKLSTAGEKEVNGKKMAAVKVERELKPATTLYFDKETGLLARVDATAKDESQGWKEVLHQVYLEDYKDIGGRKYYTKMRAVQDGKLVLEDSVFNQKFDEKLDPKLFEVIN